MLPLSLLTGCKVTILWLVEIFSAKCGRIQLAELFISSLRNVLFRSGVSWSKVISNAVLFLYLNKCQT
jgi:hypothetical protein